MICFLTSNPFLEGGLNPANGFADALRSALPAGPVRALYIASSPDEPKTNAFYAAEQRERFEASGIRFASYKILERRTAARAAAWVAQADLIVLTGGHVPTQNRFFQDIGLKRLLDGFEGVLIGISAGTMNAASTVYSQPELPGEAIDADYPRFLPGLGLTEAMIIPHFDGNLAYRLDGLRIWADVSFPDSVGRRFYALPDGSYLFIHEGGQELRGVAYLIENAALRVFCDEGQSVKL
ncbi:MAG: Type 1 glutamine amidotransferase-like domain-containing protein [Clostridia bacterium]|nr:Type 1 glutamine amidotransferase-like domain-containing protein [Clostridia bacterium]